MVMVTENVKHIGRLNGDLRSRTQGRGQYTMEPSHYIELPKGLQEKLINKRTGRENF